MKRIDRIMDKALIKSNKTDAEKDSLVTKKPCDKRNVTKKRGVMDLQAPCLHRTRQGSVRPTSSVIQVSKKKKNNIGGKRKKIADQNSKHAGLPVVSLATILDISLKSTPEKINRLGDMDSPVDTFFTPLKPASEMIDLEIKVQKNEKSQKKNEDQENKISKLAGLPVVSLATTLDISLKSTSEKIVHETNKLGDMDSPVDTFFTPLKPASEMIDLEIKVQTNEKSQKKKEEQKNKISKNMHLPEDFEHNISLLSSLKSTSKPIESNNLDNVDSPVAPPYSSRTPLATKAFERKNDVDSPMAPPYSPLTPLATKAFERKNDVDSPMASPYSPLTLLVAATKAVCKAFDRENDINSPAAPPYSPLTPLIASNTNEREPSPLPPMSPETFKQFETLSQTFQTTEELNLEITHVTNKEKAKEPIENEKQANNDNLTTDCSDDSDYCVPNKKVNSDNKSLKKIIVPESEESSDDDLSVVATQTHALVHHSGDLKATAKNKISTISRSKARRCKSKNLDSRKVKNKSEEAMDVIEIWTSDNDYGIQEKCDEDQEEDYSCDTDSDYVPEDSNNNRRRKRYVPDSGDEFDDLAASIQNEIVHCLENDEVPDEMINLEIQNETQNEHEKGRPKKGRKRKYPDHTIAQRKCHKYNNLPYNGKTKRVESKVFHDFACKCNNQCFVLVSREKREEEFKKYTLCGSYEAQLLYILNNVKESAKMRSYTVSKNNKTGKKKPRSYKRTYSICDIVVCKEMFLNNFQISSKKVDVALQKKRSGKTIKDLRGKAQGGWNKTPDEDFEFVKKVINSLPTYESHYRREQSDFKYLKLGMTVQKIYEIYKEEFKNEYDTLKKPVSFATVKRIFYSNFNLRCKSLKKDTCNRCDAFTHKIKNCTSDDVIIKLREEKDVHLKTAENLRKEMNNDLLRAKTDKKFECLTFDLEKTLPLPRIPTNVVFYKRQLWLYNSGIHVGSSDTGYCNVWVEGEAGRGSQEVGSCLVHFIKKYLDKNVEELALWSDSCGGQNRNIKIVAMLKAVLNDHPSLKTITFKFLEPGHTFLPNDTDFSKIEYQLKYHERIYTPDEYINVMKSCKQKNPLKVYNMQKEDFISVSQIEKNMTNRKTFTTKEKVNWLKTKQILLKKDHPYSIFMKCIDEPFLELDIGKKVKGKKLPPISEKDFTLLWPNGKEIAQAKLDDLKSMFELIPKDCLIFYKSLKGNSNIVDDVDGFGCEPDFEILLEQDKI